MAEEEKKYPRIVYPNGPGALDANGKQNKGVKVHSAEEEAKVMSGKANNAGDKGADWGNKS